jgi:hypothetical protein
MPFTLYHFLTANWHYVPTVIYIASCLYLKLVLYLLNINSKARYSNPWITPRVYRNLQKYLKRWRFMMAHLNEQIDVYFKVHYRVNEYNLRTLPPRTTIIPKRQYHAIRTQRQHRGTVLDKHVSRLSPLQIAPMGKRWLLPPPPHAHIGSILIQTPMTYWWITAVANPSPIV